MANYTGDNLSDLNTADPTGIAPVAEGDDAIRQIKRFLRKDGAGGLMGLIYGVGHIWTSTVNNNPALTLGFGTWIKLEEVVLVAHKDGSAEFGTVTANKSGSDVGEKTHALTIAELPAHTHTIPYTDKDYNNVGGEGANYVERNNTTATSPVGSNVPHNNIQPSRVVYMWERTA